MRPVLKAALLITVLLLALPAFAQSDTTPEPMASSTIGLGDTVTGTLSETTPSATYTLEAEAGQAVTITLSSNDFDTYLTLMDGNGNVLAENDDTNGTNSALQTFVLPQAVSYQLLVESYGSHNNSGAETGSYTLTAIEQQIAHVEYTQSVNDSLTTDALSKDYVFTGQEGDVIVATLKSADFDAYLHLLDSTGSEIASNDDSAGSRDSQIGPFTLPATGSYTLRASSFSGDTPGRFTLELNKVELTALSYGESTDVEFTKSGQAKYFTFDGSVGDLVSITADSGGSIDTSLTLNDPYNSQVANDEDSGAGADPEIYQQLLTQQGTYTVMLQAVSGSSGTVTLTIQRVPPPSLDEGAQTIDFTSSATTRAVAFEGNAGETVQLNLAVEGSGTGVPNISVLQGGQTIASASMSSVQSLSFSFVTPDDGEIIVQINDYSYDTVSYTISLERQGTASNGA